MKNFCRYASFVIVATLILLMIVPCFATDPVITIDSVEFEEYSDIYGERDEHTVKTKIKYTVPDNTESVTLSFLAKNTSDPAEFMQKAIYIDQFDEPTGEYEFLIERSRVAQALGTSDIEGKNLYLKMGASNSDAADVMEVTYNTPSCTTFEGAQIRTEGVQGLRFIFSVPKSVYDTLEHPASYSDTGLGLGSVVLPQEYLGDEKLVKDLVSDTGKKAKTIPAVKLFNITDDRVYYTVCIIDIEAESYEEEFVAVPYITYEKDGETVTEYGMQTQNVSVFSVAELYYNDEKTTDAEKTYLYDNILSSVDPEKYPKG